MIAARIAKLRESLAEYELDAVLITNATNRRYLSGFTGSAGVLLITAEAQVIATDFRYYEQVAEQAADFQLVKIEAGKKFIEILPGMLKDVAARRVGFESDAVSYAQFQTWQDALKEAKLEVQWLMGSGAVERIRMIKDEAELTAIKAAVALSDAAVTHIREWLEPGMTEKQIAWELEVFMRTRGAEKVAFDIITAGGKNGAKPHAQPTDRVIQEGEPLVMDLGARLNGYHSDLTRTVCVGEPDAKFREIYGIVLQAQLAAEEAARPGMTGKELDAVARQIIEDAGYGDYYGHGLGHGVGLEIHEKPTCGKISKDVLLPGMVFTVEPGIYLPDWGGVRIEDIVVMRADRVEVLSQAAK